MRGRPHPAGTRRRRDALGPQSVHDLTSFASRLTKTHDTGARFGRALFQEFVTFGLDTGGNAIGHCSVVRAPGTMPDESGKAFRTTMNLIFLNIAE